MIAINNTVQPPEALGIGELVWSHGPAPTGEVALMVRDDHQRKGIGTILGRELLALAQALDVATLQAHLLPENRASLRLLQRLGVVYVTTVDGELLHIKTRANGAAAQVA